MVSYELNQRYFNWIYELVCGQDSYNRLSYKKLLTCLFNIEFTYSIYMDKNRAEDGIEFRYHFGNLKGYSDRIISKYIDDKPCSVLEMIVALAFRVENEIMDDSTYGNRTGQWFWNMIVSLGLGSMSDSRYNKREVDRILDIFLNRTYEANGRGGLFTIEDCPYDLRAVDIWYQMMWYLNTIL